MQTTTPNRNRKIQGLVDLPFLAVRGPLARGVPSPRISNGRVWVWIWIWIEPRRRVSSGQQQRRQRRWWTRRWQGQEAKVERGIGPACVRAGSAFCGGGSFKGELWVPLHVRGVCFEAVFFCDEIASFWKLWPSWLIERSMRYACGAASERGGLQRQHSSGR